MAKKKILVVDDESSILQVLTMRLTVAGYEVCTAENGTEAIATAKRDKPDLIIMDVLMPKMTGFEALRKIREDGELKRVPTIIISAKSSMRDFFRDLPVEFIPKPYDAKFLLSRIENLLGNVPGRMPGAPRRAILLGVEDFLIKKIQPLLSSLNFQVITALNEDDAFQTTKKIRPDMVLCQFWEDEKTLDAKKLYERISGDITLTNVAFCVYSREAISLDAMKTFRGKQLITYKESTDLLAKLETLVKETASDN